MKKLFLILLTVLISLFAKAQYEADSCVFYPDMYVDSSKIYKNKYHIDIENRNDSTLVFIKATKKIRLSSELLLTEVIGIKVDDDGCQFTTFLAKEIRLDKPEFVTLIRNRGSFVGVAISDGESLMIWYIKKRDSELRP